MSPSAVWFLVLALLSALAFWVGVRVGARRRSTAWSAVVAALAVLGASVWLIRSPMVAVRLFPADVLSYLEGVGAAPCFLFIIGVAFALARGARARRIAVLGACMGAVYFLNGGLWMLQSTPAWAFGCAIEGGMIPQSQDYSCVPAACATALRQLDIPATEAEMAQFTQTRPGSGATLVRAYDGLTKRLAGEPWAVELLQLSYEELMVLPPPMLTPLQTTAARRHMVVVRRATTAWVTILDPQGGETFLPREEFEGLYLGQVLVFHPR